MPSPHVIIFIGAGVVVVGSTIAAWGGYLQNKQNLLQREQQLEFERETRERLDETVKSIIGGDSYCYVGLQVGGGEGGWISNPTAVCDGEHPMYDISVRIYDPEKYSGDLKIQEAMASDIFLDVGNLRNGMAAPFYQTHSLNLDGRDEKVLWADISARNGFYRQKILFKKVNNHWKRAFKLYEGFSDNSLYEFADDEFPRDENGDITWGN